MASNYTPRFLAFVPTFILREECDWPSVKTGEYSNDPDDPGGETKWGIDLSGYRAKHGGRSIDIKGLSEEDAVEIYWTDYWVAPGVENYAYPLGEAYCNCEVNGGHPTEWVKLGDAAKFIDAQKKYYRDLCAYWQKRGKPHPYKYLAGWLGRCARLRTFLKLA